MNYKQKILDRIESFESNQVFIANDYITGKLDELRITVENRKRKFDHFVWYLNR